MGLSLSSPLVRLVTGSLASVDTDLLVIPAFEGEVVTDALPAIDRATRQLLSGHGLQQWTLALAALPVLNALQAMGRGTLRHNPHAAARLTA